MELQPQHRSIWEESLLIPSFPPLEKDIVADVCVVGAGIAGVSVTYELVKEGKSAARRSTPTRGVSARAGGLGWRLASAAAILGLGGATFAYFRRRGATANDTSEASANKMDSEGSQL